MDVSLGKTLSLRGLELFVAIAARGSLRDAAQQLDLSPPAASQQLRNLETALGQDLLVHNRRPLELTRAGRAYLPHAIAALDQLRQGAVALSLNDLTRLRRLRLGIIDDFDTEVTPRLTVGLAGVLTQCDLSLLTAPSHTILSGISAGDLDLGIAAAPRDLPEGLLEVPLLRDPFVLVTPRGHLPHNPQSIEELGRLPFLRYERSQLIARQIATHLARLKCAPEGRVELDSNQAIFGLIASGAGWAISTALGSLRARRYQGQVDIYPLPFAAFSRRVSLFRPLDWQDEVGDIIARSLRGLLQVQVVTPGLALMPWLAEDLEILDLPTPAH